MREPLIANHFPLAERDYDPVVDVGVPVSLATANRISFRPVPACDALVVRITKPEPGLPVVPIKGVGSLPHDLDLLLRHPLLPQPGGCEGILGVEVVPHPRHPAASELDHPVDGRFDLRSACPAAP